MGIDLSYREITRYGLGGAFLAIQYSTVFWIMAVKIGACTLLANTVAFIINLIFGWLIHSRWSFADSSLSALPVRAYLRFTVVSLFGFWLNNLWCWIIVDYLQKSPTVALVPIVTITPASSFLMNKLWIFNQT